MYFALVLMGIYGVITSIRNQAAAEFSEKQTMAYILGIINTIEARKAAGGSARHEPSPDKDLAEPLQVVLGGANPDVNDAQEWGELPEEEHA